MARDYPEMAALLLGATSGIGLAIATALAVAGVKKIAINGRDPARARAARVAVLAAAPATQVLALCGDATRRDSINRLVDDGVAEFGGLDILVNAVPGASPPAPFEQADADQFALLIEAHLHSTLFACHAALPHLIARGGGVILTIASDAAKIPTPGESVHGALMAALDMFSRTLALESARHGIRVHSLTPSIVTGTISHDRMMADPFSRKLFEKAKARAALGVPTPEDVAALAVFLAGPAAARLTGQSITVNGGLAVA